MTRCVVGALVGAVFLVGCSETPVVDVSQEEDGRPVLKTVIGPGTVVLPGGSVQVVEGEDTGIEEVTLSVSGLPALAAGQYEVRLFSRDGGAFTPVQGLVTVDDGAESRTGTFGPADASSSITITVDADAGADLNANSHVVVAMAGVADTEFLFAEYRGVDGSGVDNALTFGGFDGPDVSHEFQVAGSGQGRFLAGRLEVDLVRVSPALPEGFHYQSYMVAVDGEERTSVQRLNRIQLDELGNGMDVIQAGDVGGDFGAFNFYMVVLEPDTESTLTEIQVQVSEDYSGKFSDFFGQ